LKLATRNFISYWLPAIVWTALVLSASSDFFSGAHTGSLLETLITALLGEVPRERLVVAHFLVRKLAHLTEYAILAWLFYRARGRTQRAWNGNWAIFALVGVAVVAAIDEGHQHFVPSRVGSPIDVLIDICGGLLALAIVRSRWHSLPQIPEVVS
jgi:VanZ family protein